MQNMMELAAVDDFKSVTIDMQRLLCSMYSATLGQSLCIENALQKERWAEEHEQANSTMRYSRVWWKPIQKRLLVTVFNMKEVSCDDVKPSSDDPKRVPASFCKPSLQSLSDARFRNIVGTKEPAWSHWSPASVIIREFDSAALREAHRSDSWHLLSRSWLSCLFVQGLLVRRKDAPFPWVISLGVVQGVGALGWPAEEVTIAGGAGALRPKTALTIDELQLLQCADPDQWEAQPFKWASPLRVARVDMSAMSYGILAIDPQGRPVLVASRRRTRWFR